MLSTVIGSTGTLRSNGPPRAGWSMPDVVDDFHALDDLAEHRVAPTRRPRVQIDVVGEVDVELSRSGMRLVGACEPDRPAQVAEPVA